MPGPVQYAIDKRGYEAHGFLIFDPRLPASLIHAAHADVRNMLDAQKAKRNPAARPAYRETDSDLHLKSEAVREIISHNAFHALASALIGPDADLRFCTTMTKTAESGEPLDWHQDWGLDRDPGHRRFSCWIALTDADVGNGCVQVLPGSHMVPIREHKASKTHPPDRGIDGVDESRAVPIELAAGQVLVVHPQLIHGSGRNVSGKERMAVLSSYQEPKSVYDPFWAKAGMRFSKGDRKVWESLPRT